MVRPMETRDEVEQLDKLPWVAVIGLQTSGVRLSSRFPLRRYSRWNSSGARTSAGMSAVICGDRLKMIVKEQVYDVNWNFWSSLAMIRM